MWEGASLIRDPHRRRLGRLGGEEDGGAGVSREGVYLCVGFNGSNRLGHSLQKFAGDQRLELR